MPIQSSGKELLAQIRGSLLAALLSTSVRLHTRPRCAEGTGIAHRSAGIAHLVRVTLASSLCTREAVTIAIAVAGAGAGYRMPGIFIKHDGGCQLGIHLLLIDVEEQRDHSPQGVLDRCALLAGVMRIGPVEEGEGELEHIKDDVAVLDMHFELVRRSKGCRRRRSRRERYALLLLFAAERVNLRKKRFGSRDLLVVVLERDSLVVETSVEVLCIDFSPYPIPLAERTVPLLVLLLETVQDDGRGHGWTLVQRIDGLVSLVAPIDLADHALVEAARLSPKPWLESELRTLLARHERDARNDRLEQRDRPPDRLEVHVVPMPLLLTARQRVLVGVLAVRSRTFRCPGGESHPVVVEDAPAQCVPP